MKRWLTLTCLLMLLLSGCWRGQETSVKEKLVTQITITCNTDDGQIQRYYTSQDKMRSVLLYIRSVKTPFDAQQQPQEGEGVQVKIVTVTADQTVKTYWQQGLHYFREGEENWRAIDPEKGANLWMIIKLLPSDPE